MKLYFWQFSQFKNWFLAIFEIAKNGIWWKKLLVKLIYLFSRVFWLTVNLLAAASVIMKYKLKNQKTQEEKTLRKMSIPKMKWKHCIRESPNMDPILLPYFLSTKRNFILVEPRSNFMINGDTICNIIPKRSTSKWSIVLPVVLGNKIKTRENSIYFPPSLEKNCPVAKVRIILHFFMYFFSGYTATIY